MQVVVPFQVTLKYRVLGGDPHPLNLRWFECISKGFPSWYRPKFMNSTLEMNLKTISFGNGSGQCLDPRGAKLQVRALSPGAYDSLRSLYKGEAFVQALQGSSSDECCITRLTCRQWQEMARASIHFLIRWFL